MATISAANANWLAASSSESQLNDLQQTFSSTDLVLGIGFLEGNENPEASPFIFDTGGSASANFIAIRDTGNTTSNTDVRAFVYGHISPGAIASPNCKFDWQFSGAPAVSIYLNVSGVETASVAAATNYIDEAVIVDASSSATMASGGTSGNDLLVVACAQGNNMGSPTVTGFTTIIEGETSATTSDFYYYVGHLAGGAPAGASVDWAASNESTAVLIELVNSGGGSPSVVALRRRRM